jgi:hypothetical protein
MLINCTWIKTQRHFFVPTLVGVNRPNNILDIYWCNSVLGNADHGILMSASLTSCDAESFHRFCLFLESLHLKKILACK